MINILKHNAKKSTFLKQAVADYSRNPSFH